MKLRTLLLVAVGFYVLTRLGKRNGSAVPADTPHAEANDYGAK